MGGEKVIQMYNTYTPYKGGNIVVQIASAVGIPDTVEFVFNEYSMSVNFWLVQVIRRSIPMLTSDYSDFDVQRENKIMVIKAIRSVYKCGLKEAKDIAKWFIANVERSTEGKI